MKIVFWFWLAASLLGPVATPGAAKEESVHIVCDPLTRYIHLSYPVPKGAPEIIEVRCVWSPAGKGDWRPAPATPLLSETALRLASDDDWARWRKGELVERRAADRTRTAVLSPLPLLSGVADADFRVTLTAPGGARLAEHTARWTADNRDVVLIDDWAQVIQKGLVAAGGEAAPGRWAYRPGEGLFGTPGPAPLRPLTYPLARSGWWAVFVCTDPAAGSIRLRLTSDERWDRPASRRDGEEVLWAWRRMDRQHLVLKGPHTYTGDTPAQIRYVRLVPLTEAQVGALEADFAGKRDKLAAGYWEPYSWAFYENVTESLQHREPLLAFAQAQVALVDGQLARFGMKAVYETRKTDQLLYSTIGDPEPDNPSPTTDNVGRMQQYTNTLETELRYAKDLNLRLFANFGATNAYPGTPLQSDFVKARKDWLRGHAVKYERLDVQEYILSLYREALEIGAEGISIDFCRYPEGIDQAETATAFLRRLRALADEFAAVRRKPVPLLIRFPATGVTLWERFDYKTWVREGLVDYLCPSNLQGRHHHFAVQPYRDAVRGTKTKLLPSIDGLDWGPEMPGFFLWRLRQIYESGADGVYVYQADSRVLGRPEDRRTMRLLGSSLAVRRWWERDAALRTRASKGVYLRPPSYPKEGYHGWERLRIWLEGIPLGAVELLLDGKPVRRFDGPPYVFGAEDRADDGAIPPGEHTLTVRARDGDGSLEQTFPIRGAP